jgi:hypothetical protein
MDLEQKKLDGLNPEQEKALKIVIAMTVFAAFIFLIGLSMMLYALIIFKQPCNLK